MVIKVHGKILRHKVTQFIFTLGIYFSKEALKMFCYDVYAYFLIFKSCFGFRKIKGTARVSGHYQSFSWLPKWCWRSSCSTWDYGAKYIWHAGKGMTTALTNIMKALLTRLGCGKLKIFVILILGCARSFGATRSWKTCLQSKKHFAQCPVWLLWRFH